MLRRFMNWLLHQLQRLLAAFNGRRPNARPSKPIHSNQDDRQIETRAQTNESASSDTSASNQANISFSLQSPESSAQQVTDPSVNTLQRAIEHADGIMDTHMRLDAASSTISGNRIELSDIQPEAEEERSSTTEIQSVEQLPGIHDLLPAVEQEIKEKSAQIDASVRGGLEVSTVDSDLLFEKNVESAAASLEDVEPALSDSVLDSKPRDSEPEDSKRIAQSEQALLFSFDIVESSSNKASTTKADNDVSFDDRKALIESDEQTNGTAPRPKNDAELALSPPSDAGSQLTNVSDTPESESDSLESTPETLLGSAKLRQASLPYPWSIATPKSVSSITDEEPTDKESNGRESTGKEQIAIQSEDTTQKIGALLEEKPMQTDVQLNRQGAVEDEVIVGIGSAAKSESYQESQQSKITTKGGVVKLLFTMKEGNYHGYIEPKDGSPDILFHQKYINEDIFDSLDRGVEVVVSIKYIEGKAYATQVNLAE